MRKLLIIAGAVLLCTCSRSPTALEEVRAQGELRVVTRNSPTTYYSGPAGPEGPEYDLVRGFARHLGVRLKIVQADRFGDLLTDVESGRVHMAAAGLTVTTDRAERVNFGPAYQQVKQLLIYRRGRVAPRSVADLAGGRIEVVAQSSYVDTLQRARGQVPDLVWIEDPSADAGELLGRVANGQADFTVVDSNVFAIFQRYHPELRIAFPLTDGDALAWAFRRRPDRSLSDEAALYLGELQSSGELAKVLDRYYEHPKDFDQQSTRRFVDDIRNRLPALRQMFEDAGKRADIDWRLLAAIGYQESKWDAEAISPKGANGIMMLTPETAELMSIEDPSDAAQSILGGAKYLWRIRNRITKAAPGVPEQDLNWMMLAAYNMGYGHLLDVRRIARLQGGDPDRWGDVRTSLPRLMEHDWYTKSRWGYARGAETRDYVRNVRNYYDILVFITEGAPGTEERSAKSPVTADERKEPLQRDRAPLG